MIGNTIQARSYKMDTPDHSEPAELGGIDRAEQTGGAGAEGDTPREGPTPRVYSPSQYALRAPEFSICPKCSGQDSNNHYPRGREFPDNDERAYSDLVTGATPFVALCIIAAAAVNGRIGNSDEQVLRMETNLPSVLLSGNTAGRAPEV